MASILTINSGSSSIKVALYQVDMEELLLLRARLEGIGLHEGRFQLTDSRGDPSHDEHLSLPDHATALKHFSQWLEAHHSDRHIDAVGHRIVHGGPRYRKPQQTTPEMIRELRRLEPFDPLHLPSEIDAIEAAQSAHPEAIQVACFDTAFHEAIPEQARLFPLPTEYADRGIHRYGFHGLSYEFLLSELSHISPPPGDRVILAHLGSGASMAAVYKGQCVDTTMGFTPLAGLIMATRCGDLDPGLLLYLLEEEKLSVQELSNLLNHNSGLKGISGMTANVQKLIEQKEQSPKALLAIQMFCYQAKRHLGGLIAILGGLDTLVFTGGIGENAPWIRQEICSDLQCFGIELSPDCNQSSAPIISANGTQVTVRVIPTDEEKMIARHTHRSLQS